MALNYTLFQLETSDLKKSVRKNTYTYFTLARMPTRIDLGVGEDVSVDVNITYSHHFNHLYVYFYNSREAKSINIL
jgi:hypothetical protein